MSCFALIASAATLAGLFAACLLVFAIGKYNHLVTLRRRISTEMLQLDLALRKQSAELRALGGGRPTEFISGLADAEEKSHRAVSGHLTGGNLALLRQASEHISNCWRETFAGEQGGTVDRARNHLEATADTWKKINGLVDDYSRFLEWFPYYAVAFVCGFDPLLPGHSLPGKAH